MTRGWATAGGVQDGCARVRADHGTARPAPPAVQCPRIAVISHHGPGNPKCPRPRLSLCSRPGAEVAYVSGVAPRGRTVSAVTKVAAWPLLGGAGCGGGMTAAVVLRHEPRSYELPPLFVVAVCLTALVFLGMVEAAHRAVGQRAGQRRWRERTAARHAVLPGGKPGDRSEENAADIALLKADVRGLRDDFGAVMATLGKSYKLAEAEPPDEIKSAPEPSGVRDRHGMHAVREVREDDTRPFPATA